MSTSANQVIFDTEQLIQKIIESRIAKLNVDIAKQKQKQKYFDLELYNMSGARKELANLQLEINETISKIFKD